MYRTLAATLTAFLAVPAMAGDAKFNPDARAGVIAPFLDDQTLALVHVDISRLNVDAIADHVGKVLPGLAKTEMKQLEPLKQTARGWVANFAKAGGKELYLVFNPVDLPSTPFALVPLEEGADVRALSGLLCSGRPDGPSKRPERKNTPQSFEFETTVKVGNFVIAGSSSTLKRLEAMKPTPRHEVAKAFAAAGDTLAQVLLIPTSDNRRVLEEMVPVLPKEIGGGPITTLTRGMLWGAFGFDTTPKISLRMVIQSRGATAARALHELLVIISRVAGQQPEVRQIFPTFDKFAASFLPEIDGDRLRKTLDVTATAALFAAPIQKMSEAADRIRSANNLKQIVLAMHNYHDVYSRLPAIASYDKNGKPLLSWRVHLLPFLDQVKLYKEFHLDESWDSEHNKNLIARMPAVYRCSTLKLSAEGMTTYLAPRGEALMFPSGSKGLQIPKDIPDGTSNTIILVNVTADHAVPWTKPEDLNYDPSHPFAGLVGPLDKGFLAAFVDGSVRTISAAIEPKTLHALFTRNGGETIPVLPE